MNLEQFLDAFRAEDSRRPPHQRRVTHWEVVPARPPALAEWPAGLDPRLVDALARRGISRPFTHQAEALAAGNAGKNVVVVTPTASGKTLCYNVPVLNAILKDPNARALYLFPTKALAQDQLAELHGLIEHVGADVRTYTYDGDTSPDARQRVRTAGHVVITNPDMLHTGILPHHTKWTHLFGHLEYVVIDELHTYRGVFGSHLANVIRRLKRVCRHHGANPRFILCSATIANPDELARLVIEEDVVLVDRNGAPAAERHVIFCNPPIVNRQLGLRGSAVGVARDLTADLIANRIRTLAFGRSRLTVELLLTYLQEEARRRHFPERAVRGYRGGYLPLQRREIEQGLRSGDVLGVVSTNALELGIDIGSLEAVVMVGYPGTIASTWQQAGRAGRRQGTSATFMIATSLPLDQYVVNHPEYFFGRSPELGLVNPNNLLIQMAHLKCAAFEVPFQDEEEFGAHSTREMLEYLADERVLFHTGGKWYWSTESFPAEAISLRSASIDNFVIIDETETGRPRVIGEMSRVAVPTMLHDEAIYIHEGRQYEVTRLDWAEKKGYVRAVNVDYYTDANLVVDLRVIVRETPVEEPERAWGEVALTFVATIFKKIKLYTHENVGWGKIHLPEETFHTTAYWLTFDDARLPTRSTADLEHGLLGVANLLANIAPLHLMCDPHDVGVQPRVRDPFTGRPTVFVYETVPGGVGFAEKLYHLHDDLLAAARALITSCGCAQGCPSCVGPTAEVGDRGKEFAIALLDSALG